MAQSKDCGYLIAVHPMMRGRHMRLRTWILNVVGLVAGLSGALLMSYFPPRIQLYTEKDEPHFTWVGNPKEG